MAPLFPKHPLTAITTREGTAAAELQSGRVLESKHRVTVPIHEFPAGTIFIQVFDRCAGPVDDDFIPFSPGDTIHVTQILRLLPGSDQPEDGLLPFPAHDCIDFSALCHDDTIGIGWIDATIHYA